MASSTISITMMAIGAHKSYQDANLPELRFLRLEGEHDVIRFLRLKDCRNLGLRRKRMNVSCGVIVRFASRLFHESSMMV